LKNYGRTDKINKLVEKRSKALDGAEAQKYDNELTFRREARIRHQLLTNSPEDSPSIVLTQQRKIA
jgi:hypothetical protein